jgi:hypothetical protein
MRINERLELMEAKILKLEKEVEALKGAAGRETVGAAETAARAAAKTEKAAGAADTAAKAGTKTTATRAKRSTGK